MKWLIALLTLVALPVLADTNYIAFVYTEDLKHPDKTIEKSQSKELFQDATEVKWDDMARFQRTTNTNLKYRVVCYAVDVGTVKKDVTKEKAEKDIKDKLSEKSKCVVVACGMTPVEDLKNVYGTNDGYEPVPIPEIP